MITGIFKIDGPIDDKTGVNCAEAFGSIIVLPKDVKLMTHETDENEAKCRCTVIRLK